MEGSSLETSDFYCCQLQRAAFARRLWVRWRLESIHRHNYKNVYDDNHHEFDDKHESDDSCGCAARRAGRIGKPGQQWWKPEAASTAGTPRAPGSADLTAGRVDVATGAGADDNPRADRDNNARCGSHHSTATGGNYDTRGRLTFGRSRCRHRGHGGSVTEGIATAVSSSVLVLHCVAVAFSRPMQSRPVEVELALRSASSPRGSASSACVERFALRAKALCRSSTETSGLLRRRRGRSCISTE